MTQVNISQASYKQVEYTNDAFNYGTDWRLALAELGAKIANDKEAQNQAFNSVCHIAAVDVAKDKTTKKDRREAFAKVRDLIEQTLGKYYARAFALAISELDFSLPEQSVFDELDFSTYLGATTGAKKREPEHGAKEVLKFLENKVKRLQQKFKETPVNWVQEELDAYTLCRDALKESIKA